MSKPGPVPIKKRGKNNFGMIALYVLVLSTFGMLLYNYFSKTNNNSPSSFGEKYTNVPEELKINYIPANFSFDMDDENTLAVLSNPHRYRKEFKKLVYKFNLSLLNHVATRMNLPDSLKNRLPTEYQKHHDYLSQLYFNDFIALRDSSSALYETWYDNESTSAVEALNEVASKYTCFLVNHVITTMLKANSQSLVVKGSNVDTPCGIAMTEGLRPLIKRLQQTAAIQDFSKSKGMMEEKVESVISELATMEVRDKKGLNKQLQTKIWGMAVSSTNIEVSAISIMKIGFKLDKYFDIRVSSKTKTVWVTLAEPTILSHEVYPKVDKLDIGWLREIENNDLNKNFNILRGEFRREALASDVFEKAKVHAEELMKMMLEPAVRSIGKGYKIKIRYKRSAENNTTDLELPTIGNSVKSAASAKINGPDNKK